MSGRICPLICETGYRADGDRCVKITCRAGYELNDDRSCEDRGKKADDPANGYADPKTCARFGGALTGG